MRYWRDLNLTKRQAVTAIVLLHVVISIYWLTQAGFYVNKDSPMYLVVARRVAEVPFFDNPYTLFPTTNFILTNAPFYGYFLNALQILPGGFAPYHFLITQLLHLALIIAVFYTVTLWRDVKWALVVALLGMFEPLHYADLLVVKPSIFSQPTIGIGVCLAACGWKQQQYSWFVWSAVILGIGTIFRPFNIAFVPLIVLLALLAGQNWRKKLLFAGTVVVITILSMLPKTLFNRANPEIAVDGFSAYFLFVSNRLEQLGKFTPEYIPETMAYYYDLAPRLRDPELLKQVGDTSLPFYHAFRHERYRLNGDTPAEAEMNYDNGGLKALLENPGIYLESSLHVFLRNWGIPAGELSPYDYEIDLWLDEDIEKVFDTEFEWLNAGFNLLACNEPFETCDGPTNLDLVHEGMVDSLQRMPRPPRISYTIGQLWEKVSPFRGVVALVLLLFSVGILAWQREWAVLLVFGGTIAIYLFILTFLVLATTREMVMVVPWVAWITGMAVSSVAVRWPVSLRSVPPATSTPEQM